jgi:hypothetical protein
MASIYKIYNPTIRGLRMHPKSRLLAAFVAITLLTAIYFAMPRYRRTERVVSVDVLANGRMAYIAIVTSEELLRFRVGALVARLLRMMPPSEKVVIYRLYLVTTDGVSARCDLAPAFVAARSFMPHVETLYLDELPGGRGRLFLWNAGSAVPVPEEKAAAARASMRRYRTDQCRAEGWTCLSRGELAIGSGGEGGASLRIGERDVRIRFAVSPAGPDNPRVDQAMRLSLESAGNVLLTRWFPYRRNSHDVTYVQWEAARKEDIARQQRMWLTPNP